MRVQEGGRTEDFEEAEIEGLIATHFSVFSMNLWGLPQSFDRPKVLDHERTSRSMLKLREEITKLNPSVIGLQENNAVFTEELKPLWEKYTKCQMTDEEGGVLVGVRNDLNCKTSIVESFDPLPRCNYFSRQYTSVQVEVGSAWVTVAVLHLKSGVSMAAYICKINSLGRAFKLAHQAAPGIVMGDMNWFGWPTKAPLQPKDSLAIRPPEVIAAEKAEKAAAQAAAEARKHGKAGDRRRQGRSTPTEYAPDTWYIADIANHKHFKDAAPEDNFVTFPSWEPDPYKPIDNFAGRLDRMYYTWGALNCTHFKLVNPRVHTSANKDPKFDFISDHIGMFAQFELVGSRGAAASLATPAGSKPGSCAGLTCEYVKGRTCQCDEDCTKWSNCCADSQAVCAEALTTVGACKEIGCGLYQKSRGCQCDDGCTKWGNCCDDYKTACKTGGAKDAAKPSSL